jgi:hypothetical protein
VIQASLDFENIVEEAVANLLEAAGLNAFTTGQVYDFQKDRPRVQVQFTLGTGRLQWANPNKLPTDLQGAKVETVWDSLLHTTIVTAADENGKQDQANFRGIIRAVYLNLAAQLNGTLLTKHRVSIMKESGSSRGLHPQESNSEILQMVHELVFGLHESVWTDYERVTDAGDIRTGFTRIVSGPPPTPRLFKNITNLNSGTVVSGSDVFELVHNPGPNEENIQVTIDVLSAAIGGGGGSSGQVIAYAGTFPSSAPTSTDHPAIAYSADGSASTWYWNIAGQTWM